jgi:hypothetical protein
VPPLLNPTAIVPGIPGSSSIYGGSQINPEWNVYCDWGGASGKGCCVVRKNTDWFMADALTIPEFTGSVSFTTAIKRLMTLRSEGLGGNCVYGIIDKAY